MKKNNNENSNLVAKRIEELSFGITMRSIDDLKVRILSMNEVCNMLGKHRSSIHRYIKSGELAPPLKVGGRIGFLSEDIKLYLIKQKCKSLNDEDLADYLMHRCKYGIEYKSED